MIFNIIFGAIAVVAYFFIGAIVACMMTEPYDWLLEKMIIALFWPFILLFIIFIEKILPLPRKIADRIKDWKEGTDDVQNQTNQSP